MATHQKRQAQVPPGHSPWYTHPDYPCRQRNGSLVGLGEPDWRPDRINKDTLDWLEALPKQRKPIEFYDAYLKGYTVRKQPSGKILFYFRYRALDGRQTRVALGDYEILGLQAARTEAETLSLRIKREKHDPARAREEERAKARGELTGEEYITQHYEAYLATKAAGKETLRSLRTRLGGFLKKRLSEMTADAIRPIREQLLKEDLKPASVNRIVAGLSGMLKHAMEEHKLLPVHPFHDGRLRPLEEIQRTGDDDEEEDNGRVRYLSIKEETNLMETLALRDKEMREARVNANKWREERDYEQFPVFDGPYVDHLQPAILVAMHTGIRKGEMRKLLWRRVNLEDRWIELPPRTTKNKKWRRIPLNSVVLDALKKWRSQRPEEDKYVFPGKNGNLLSDIKTAWKTLKKRAKLSDFRWHDFRHHFASMLVTQGVDLNRVRDLLGHRSLEMTLRYAHLAPEARSESVELIARPRVQPKPEKVIDWKKAKARRKVAA